MKKLFERTNKEGTTATYYSSDDGRVVWADMSYPRSYQSTYEELEAENEKLPKTKRRYMTEDGKIVGYLTAKKLGIIS